MSPSSLQRIFALLITAFLVAPAAQAQINNPDEPTETTLYFHVFDTFNRFVINTQPMNTEFFKVGGTNNPTTPPIPELAPNGMDYNTIYGYSTAGPVEYDFIENGLPRLHPERGIAADVEIDANTMPVAYIYLDIRDVFGTDGLPNVLPDFAVRVTMREGDDPGRDANLDEGSKIMQGQVNLHAVDTSVAPGTTVNGFYDWWQYTIPGVPENPAPLPEESLGDINDVFVGQTGPDGNPVLVPDESGVLEIIVPILDLAGTTIPKAEAYNVRIDWWMLEELTGEDEFSTGYFRFVADQDHLPRLEMKILNPIYIEFIHPQVAAGTLLIHTGVNSPWGTYDIDPESIRLTVDGPASPQNLQTVVAQNQHVHGLHDKAAEITYLWKFRDESAPDGEYVINMAVSNTAGTATALGTAGFEVKGKQAVGVDTEGDVVEPTLNEGSNDSPSVGLLAAVALLGAALFARRRRA